MLSFFVSTTNESGNDRDERVEMALIKTIQFQKAIQFFLFSHIFGMTSESIFI